MNILVLGVTGTIGYSIWSAFHNDKSYNVWGTMRNVNGLNHIPTAAQDQLFTSVDVLNHDQLIRIFAQTRPDVVINCTGLIKQLNTANDPLIVLPINSLFPHQLANLCSLSHTRLIQISTDCVYSGRKGAYVETDPSDAEDLYGKSKFIGEVTQQQHAVTLRTSTIGHELESNYGLIDWFLSQNDKVKGYVKAIFSGLPTVELARVVKDYVVPDHSLTGLYHVAAKPINKYDLLNLVAEVYGKKIIIEREEATALDRSLNGSHFAQKTGYIAPEWPQLIEHMYQSRKQSGAA